MRQLRTGVTLTLTDGRRIKVQEFLGEGAQGCVYKVDVPEMPRDPNCKHEIMALKWYKKQPASVFYDNLMKNAAEGAPAPQFLWPTAVTRFQLGSAGYIMPLRPQGFYELTQFRLAKVRFKSFTAILRACMEVCEAFKMLHLKGLSYSDLNDGNFFINPNTGEVKVCDNDNVFPNGYESGIYGKARYMAPEVVSGKTLPNAYSDRFSLATVLFMMMFIDHPFEGANVLQYPCLTEELERRLYGDDLCFIFDESKKNPPVAGIHDNSRLFWDLWPESIKHIFMQEFGAEKLHNPSKRMTELEWISAFMRTRDQLICCPYCGDETFIGRECTNFLDRILTNTDRCLNRKCRKPVKIQYSLCLGTRRIPLAPGSMLYFDQIDTPSAQVHINMHDNNLLIRNLEPGSWMVTTLSGKQIPIARNEFVPVKPGLKIQTPAGCFEIRN